MADFLPAVTLTLGHEGGFFHNPVTGEVVNYGITLTFVKSCGYCATADEVYIRNLSSQTAEQIYLQYFWTQHRIGQIADQALANKVFDLTVNMGPGAKSHDGTVHPGALTLLQQAVCDCGGTCEVDGVLGPESLAAINALDPVRLLSAYRNRVSDRYKAIAGANPELTGDLAAWLARLSGD